jgi:hypothetical protein
MLDAEAGLHPAREIKGPAEDRHRETRLRNAITPVLTRRNHARHLLGGAVVAETVFPAGDRRLPRRASGTTTARWWWLPPFRRDDDGPRESVVDVLYAVIDPGEVAGVAESRRRRILIFGCIATGGGVAPVPDQPRSSGT